MVTFDREQPQGGPVIQGFSGRGFRVDGVVYDGGLWLTPEQASDWPAPAIDDLRVEDVAALLDGSPEFLLLGTGGAMRRPSQTFTAAVEAMGIGVEVMDSRAAARAWIVLRGEGRQIVAALLPL
ncbi:Uncharacterized conserved protein, contains Mth938-like domain [Sphingomonas sp. YR710]|jgi:uncharacterized protein|uniref:Mth938-like domain-containing protein n=1 Tax=Sphingomonas sp. YR710 TaxID=1882773 RepID=UPI00088F3B34|nr:MTH938/NDUFAF3 family protein [Sphingomonas sp. YR710]SDD76011.1 Uncharacterized conserved protein, contains Mth938-like domain [Sphingomonas sp. YR710]